MEFLPGHEVFRLLGSTVCQNTPVKAVCENIIFLISGHDHLHINAVRTLYLFHNFSLMIIN